MSLELQLFMAKLQHFSVLLVSFGFDGYEHGSE